MKKGIRIFSGAENGNEWLSFKAEGIIDASRDVLQGLIIDARKIMHIAPRMKEKRILKIFSPFERIDFDYFSLAWPFADRYLIYKVHVIKDGNRRLITMNSVEDFPHQEEDKVLARINNGKILLEPLSEDGGKTLVAIEVHIDMGGWIPRWLINLYGEQWPYQFLRNLKYSAASIKRGSPRPFS